MTREPNPRLLAERLHDITCHGLDWESEAGRTQHIKNRFVSRAREILSAPSPAEALHSLHCPAEMDRTFPNGCGIDLERHIDVCQKWLNSIEDRRTQP